MLIARYCKLFGLNPADEVGIIPEETTMRMAINWACYVAYVQSENEEHQKAQEKGTLEADALSKFVEELKEQSTSSRN